MSRRRCTHHCRRCGAHFSSLAAFDAHHAGSGAAHEPCVFPEDAPLVELEGGICSIAGTETKTGVAISEHASAAQIRDHFRKAKPGAGRKKPRERPKRAQTHAQGGARR